MTGMIDPTTGRVLGPDDWREMAAIAKEARSASERSAFRDFCARKLSLRARLWLTASPRALRPRAPRARPLALPPALTGRKAA